MTKIFLDNQFIRMMNTSELAEKGNSFIQACLNADIFTADQKIHVILEWPSLLEYLNMGNLLEEIPLFDQNSELYLFFTSLLSIESENELLIRAYDQLFVECLTHVKALPQINPEFLLQQIRKKQNSSPSLIIDKLFAQSIEKHEERLLKNPADAMHDLILYLAWDRICVSLAIVFEQQLPNAPIQNKFNLLKECLLESFQHITGQGRTTPGLFRLIEALYAHEMREENLEIHTESEWSILCQGASTLNPRNTLSDIWYIDAAVCDEKKLSKEKNEKKLLKVFTLASPDKVKASLSLVQSMIDKLKREWLEWHYALCPLEIICFEEKGKGLSIRQQTSSQ